MSRIGLYAGSFDPPTLGHLWVIRQGAEIFDELVIAVAVNPDKHPMLTQAERQEALQAMVAEVQGCVRVVCMQHLFLVDFARELGASFLLRGVRNALDFEYEKNMARMNERMAPGLRTLFLMPPGDLEAVSSSMVRSLVGLPSWESKVASCVHPAVLESMKRAYDRKEGVYDLLG